MKSKGRARPATVSVGGEGEKMQEVMNEVDRFFKSVHADIEDWKFSMEDYGDGTRIFVRFQVHFDKSVVSAHPRRSTAPGASPEENGARPALPAGRSVPPRGNGEGAIEDSHAPNGPAAAVHRAELDLASFVEDWRDKRESNFGGEFHKVGAPYVDGPSEWNGHKRIRQNVAPKPTGEPTDGEPKAPDANS